MAGYSGNAKVLKNLFICVLLLAVATGTGYIFHIHHLLDTNIVMIYMLCVLLTSSMTEGFIYGILEAFLAMGTFNYFFVSPYYSLNVDHVSYAISLVIMFGTAVITSMITSKAKVKEKEARERENETVFLLHLTNQAAEAQCMEDVMLSVVKHTQSILNCKIACAVTAQDGSLCSKFVSMGDTGETVWEELQEKEQLEQAFTDSECPESVDTGRYRNWPVFGQSRLLGILRIPLKDVHRMKRAQMRLVTAVRETVCLAMDRIYVREQQMRDNAMMEKERYRATLLRSISHDLRTPLAGIMGTLEMLLDMEKEEERKARLVRNAGQDAQWLYELVENVLSLTRMQDGELIHKEQEACEEVVEAAVRRIQGRLEKRKIQVQVPEECLLASMDIRLIGQVLANILDNAVKHTQPDGEIRIMVEKQGEEAVFEVMDDGRGILEEDMPNIFQLFYTTRGENTDKSKGTGIGLAICESIVKAHGGRIWAANRTDRQGAVFWFALPI